MAPMKSLKVLSAVALTAALLSTAVAQAQAPAIDLKKTDTYYADPSSPNIAGFWRRVPGPIFSVGGKALPAPDEHGHQIGLPYRPDWQKAVDARYAADLKGAPYGDPLDACWPAGTFGDYLSEPAAMKITETPGRIQLMFERGWTKRLIFTNRKHLEGGFLIQTVKGDSIATWKGKSLVADTIGVRPEVTLGYRLPHSEKVRFIETFTRTGPETLKIEVTILDPEAFTKPVQATLNYRRDAQGEFKEDFCMDHNNVIIDANLVVHPDTRRGKTYGFDLPN
jgi:hypothetical protein